MCESQSNEHEAEVQRLMRGRIFKGEAGLRFARFHARRSGDHETARKITDILRDEDKSAVAAAMLEETEGGGKPIQGFIQFIVDHWDQIKAIIEELTKLFAGAPVV